MGMAHLAALAALKDANAGLIPVIDCVMSVRTMSDSLPAKPAPQGACANPPRTLAALLGAKPRRAIYGCAGGETPQALLAEACGMLHRKEARCVLIASGEAMAAQKMAARAGMDLDWRASADGPFEDRGFGALFVSGQEIRHGISLPVQAYALIEHALRARLGRTRSQHVEAMAQLFAPFSRIAAGNPFAQFPQARTADFLASMSPENYPFADPYRKWLIAQDRVNQGAAVLLMRAGDARAAGLRQEHFIYLHGQSEAVEKRMILRPDLSRSPALVGAMRAALDSADLRIEDIAHFDIYSCFPCAVFLAIEAMGLAHFGQKGSRDFVPENAHDLIDIASNPAKPNLDFADDATDWPTRAWTITGGLPFFGGPGNAYALHAIAEMAMRLRRDRGAFGLISANGGFLSKQAIGIYGANAPRDWQPVSSAGLQAALDAGPDMPALAGDGEALIESYTAAQRPDGGVFACVIARNGMGQRALAKARRGDAETVRALSTGADPIGRAVHIQREGDDTYFRLV
jgi:acetyl-CoA C-acetyltransferase